ncbi:MAG: MarR family transcriptional regulator [Bacteroidota bacterium]
MNPPHFQNALIPWIGKTAKLIHIHINDVMAQEGIDLTMQQCIVLIYLYEKDDVSQQELALITERNKGSLARLIHSMERKHLVARVPSEVDKRAKQILLTRKGLETIEKVKPLMEQTIQELQHGLSQEEIQLAIQVIQKLQQNLKLTL